ncbi:Ku protein [Clostridiaceae bacterium M8S5]|nr:Ku protein [Clostridiaceae bacterium M8S5]
MHTMWKGSISFGLVNIPVKMFTATENKDIRFRYLHKECNTPVRYKKYCESCGREVKEEEIVRGFEYEKGHFVIMNEEDFELAKSEVLDKAIDIIDFVNLVEIDPIYFDKSYYLSPDQTGSKAYNLLRSAMNDTSKIALAKITIRNKQSLAALRVYQNTLVLETLFYPDEVREVSNIPNLPENINVDDKELKIATQLIDQLTTEFKPENYKDDYREALNEIIENKIHGQETIKAEAKTTSHNVVDLMSALKASLKDSKAKNTKKQSIKPKKGAS